MKPVLLIMKLFVFIGMMAGCGNNNGTSAEHTGWAVGTNVDGYGTIIHTEDSGKSWVRQGDEKQIPDIFINDVSAVDAQHSWAVGGSAPDGNGTRFGTILYTQNGGTDWTRQGSADTLPDTEFSGVSALSPEMAWVVGTSGEILYTDDGGTNWNRQDGGQFSGVFFQMVSAVDTQHVWAAGGFNNGGAFIARTTDGKNWETVNLNIFGDVQAFIDLHAVDANVVWAVGTSGTVAVTRNGGETWIRTGPGGLLHVNGVCALDENRAWIAVDSYTLYYTSDGGFTWTQQDKPSGGEVPTLSGAYMSVTAINSQQAWLVGFNAPGVGNWPVIKSTDDGGATWTAQTSPANAQLRRVSFVGDVRP